MKDLVQANDPSMSLSPNLGKRKRKGILASVYLTFGHFPCRSALAFLFTILLGRKLGPLDCTLMLALLSFSFQISGLHLN